MDQFVISFPALAAWLIVVIGGGLLALVAFGGRKLLERLDAQDGELRAIRDLLQSEVQQLREMSHQMDIRLTRIESSCRFFHGIGPGNHNGLE